MTTGLTSEFATRKLRDAIDFEAKKFANSKSVSNVLRHAFLHHFPTSSCWVLISAASLLFLAFIFARAFTSDSGIRDHDHVGISAAVLLVIICGTCALNVYMVFLRTTEIRRKVDTIVRSLNELVSNGFAGLTTPSLYEPASESITLQWTYRDGSLVNLPWIALVEGDIILLRPGREIPCRCRSIDSNCATMIEFESGQIYMPQQSRRTMDGVGVEAFVPLPCLVNETPAASYVRACLSASERPPSLTENEYGRIIHTYIERIGLPILFGISFTAAVFIYMYHPPASNHWYDTLILTPAAVSLPLAAPLFTLYTWMVVLVHTAKFLVRFSSSLSPTFLKDAESEKEDAELFTEANISDNSMRITGKSSRRSAFSTRHCSPWSRFLRVSKCLWKLLKGDPTSLPFSANIVQTLGNVTSLSIVDKKGIMSWANPTAEKVFFFSRSCNKKNPSHANSLRKKHRQTSTISLPSVREDSSENPPSTCRAERIDDASPVTGRRHLTVEHQAFSSPALIPRTSATGKTKPALQVHHKGQHAAAKSHAEVQDLSHDPHRSFVVHFDDPHWRTFSNSLKPLGLNILLNSCNLHAEYMRFIDHVHAISAVVPRTVAAVNRRCLCYLARAIGFTQSTCAGQFEMHQTLAAYRKTPGDLPVPGLTKHRTPLPNLFAVIVRDKITGHSQLMCQGTADLVADACEFYWDGVDVKPLDKQYRKKISDFSQRHSVTAYCVAFSYRPLAHDVDKVLGDIYIDWPTPSRRQPVGSMDSLFTADELRPWARAISYDSLLCGEYFEVQKIEAPADVLHRLLKSQVFLGMISLQYQAKPDVVRLVDSLDKACVRFVHYSKENELRSRIFAEKCGLEAGWNCHISLGRESEAISATGSQLLTKIGLAYSATSSRSGLSVSEKCKRQSLPGDFKIDLPTVHFKSAVATPTIDAVPQVVCTSTEVALDASKERRTEEDDETEAVGESFPNEQLERGDRCASVATISADSVFDDPADQQLINALRSQRERTPLLSDTTSRTSVVTNHSLVHQPIILPPNRARLPKGIENIRPHLESVDNVPLLVPLFTDCYPSAIVEMVSIMQEYGEVVCIVGSSLNYRNAETFCQANASIGMEPLRPAVCVNRSNRNKMESSTDASAEGGVSATTIATIISTLPCSISVYAGERINLLDLIATSRHLLIVLRTSWLFYLSASMTTAAVQLLAQLIVLPRPFTIDLLVWLVCFVIPVLSGSLCCTSQHSDVLKTATPKNSNWVSKNSVEKFLMGFALKFLPSAIFALLLFACSSTLTCASTFGLKLERCILRNDSLGNDWNGSIEGEKIRFTALSTVGLTVSRHLFTFLFVLYLCAISSGYVHYRALYKDRFPWTNVTWFVSVIFLLCAQFFYLVVRVRSSLNDLPVTEGYSRTNGVISFIPWKVYVCGLVWPFVSISLNELLKRYELDRYRRDQRRRKLSFGTKLGMNSPF